MNLSENFNRDYLLKIEIFSKSHNHLCLYPLKLATTLKSIMNAKLSKHRFWYCHKNRHIKTIQMIPYNLLGNVKSASLH